MKWVLRKYGFLIVSLVIISSGVCLAENKKKVFSLGIQGTTRDYKLAFELHEKDFRLICNCLENYQRSFDELSVIVDYELCNDDMVYEKFLHDFSARTNGDLILSKTGNRNIDKYIEFINNNGLRVNRSMDGLKVFPDPMYIVNNFKGILSDTILEYYIILNQDITEGYESDAGFTVPWDTLRLKVIRYENFLKKISNIDCFYIQSLAKEKIDKYLRSYLYGLDNTPVLIDEGNRLEPEAQKSFERFLEKNTDSKYYKIVKLFYEKAMNGKLKFKTEDPAIDKLLRESRNYY